MANGVPAELVRTVNDRWFTVLSELGAQEGVFACECGRRDCSERLELTLIEYASRAEGETLLATGHGRGSVALVTGAAVRPA
jgi:hypothetical protein